MSPACSATGTVREAFVRTRPPASLSDVQNFIEQPHPPGQRRGPRLVARLYVGTGQPAHGRAKDMATRLQGTAVVAWGDTLAHTASGDIEVQGCRFIRQATPCPAEASARPGC